MSNTYTLNNVDKMNFQKLFYVITRQLEFDPHYRASFDFSFINCLMKF